MSLKVTASYNHILTRFEPISSWADSTEGKFLVTRDVYRGSERPDVMDAIGGRLKHVPSESDGLLPNSLILNASVSEL